MKLTGESSMMKGPVLVLEMQCKLIHLGWQGGRSSTPGAGR